MAEDFPEYAALRIPLLSLALAFTILAQLALVAVIVLVHRIRVGRMLHRVALLWVDVIVVTLACAVVLVVVGFGVISEGQAGSPFLLLVQVMVVLTLVVLALLTLVLRSLLRHAIALNAELEEVV